MTTCACTVMKRATNLCSSLLRGYKASAWAVVATVMVALSALPLSRLDAQFRFGSSAGSQSAQTPPQTVSPDSPRANVREFLTAAGQGDWETAAEFLALTSAQRERGPVLARRLNAVIEQRLNLDISVVSPLAEGDTTDGDHGVDRLGVIIGSRQSAGTVGARAATRAKPSLDFLSRHCRCHQLLV